MKVNNKIISLFIVGLLFMWPISSLAVTAESEEASLIVDAKGAILIDGASGKVLFEQNSNKKLPLASVTKVMTMLLILEAVERGQLSLNDQIAVSERAAGMGGSQMYLEAGEVQPLELLMEGVAICSANDACVAVAEYHSGTVEIFVENMNKRAKELGMKNTNFVNTNGLPVANHYSSAYDIGLMSKELLKHKGTEKWFTTWQTNIMVGLPGKQTELGLTNTNRLIKSYPGAIGIKTGFTQDAMYCLSGAAKKENLTLIGVILGSPTSQVRFSEVSKLFDYGFANFESLLLAEKGEPLEMLELDKANPKFVNVLAPDEISVLIKKGEKDGVRGETVFTEAPKLPIIKGQQIGELIVYQNDKEIGRHPLVSEEAANKAGYFELYIRMLKEGVK